MSKATCRAQMILSMVLLVTLNARAEQEYQKCTSADDCKARIAQHQATLSTFQKSQFLAVYVDDSLSLPWSKALPGTYSNGCVSAYDQYDKRKCSFVIGRDMKKHVSTTDSEAAKACWDISGRLPTEGEVQSLIRKFDHVEKDYGPKPTDNGMAAIRKQFDLGDNGKNAFWLSSIDSGSPTHDYASAFIFSGDGSLGQITFYDRSIKGTVLCVKDSRRP